MCTHIPKRARAVKVECLTLKGARFGNNAPFSPLIRSFYAGKDVAFTVAIL
jgi:hypothetical protein